VERGGGTLTGADLELGQNGINLTNASPLIQACTLARSQYDGLVCAGTSSPVVVRSRFLSNGRHGVYVSGTAAPNLGNLLSASLLDDGRNTLKGNAGYDLYNDTANTLYAQNNQWASTDPTAIAKRIFDQADSPTRGQVIFSPTWKPVAQALSGAPLAVSGLTAVSTGSGSVCFTWTQTNAGFVDICVSNLAGRLVAQPCQDRPLPAGGAAVLWSRRGSQGSRLPAGTYWVALQSRQPDGATARLLAPLVLP